MKKVSVTTTPNAYRKRGGGGNNLSLNTPSQSTLDSSSNALSSSLRALAQDKAWQSTQTESQLRHCEPMKSAWQSTNTINHKKVDSSTAQTSSTIQHSLAQETRSALSAKRKRFIPSTLPLAQKEKATAFSKEATLSFCNQGESLALPLLAKKRRRDTTARLVSAFWTPRSGREEVAPCGAIEKIDSASAECMDCHATAAAVSGNDSISNAYTSTNTTHNDSKATATPSTANKLTLCVSLALAGVLCRLAAQEAPTPLAHAVLKHCYDAYCRSYNLNGGGFWIDLDNGMDSSTTTYITGNNKNPATDWRIENNAQVGTASVTTKDVANKGNKWLHLMTASGFEAKKATLNMLILKEDTRFEIKNLQATTTIKTINQEAIALHIRDSVNITTLNQNSAGETKIYGSGVKVTTANVKDGIFEQQNGTITTANVNGGTFTQSGGTTTTLTQSGGQATQTSGTITTADVKGGTFTQSGGETATLTQSGGQATQTNGTITTLNLKGGVFTHDGGTLGNITLQDGNGAFINNTNTTVSSITQNGGTHIIHSDIATLTQNGGSLTQEKGQITTLTQNGGSSIIKTKATTVTLKSGSLTNNGEITTLTTATASTQEAKALRAATQDIRAATAANSTIINGAGGYFGSITIDNTALTNNGKIKNLTLNNGSNVINNATIESLTASNGSSTINTLNGVAYDDTTGRSTLTINQGANLKVETLDVGLRGNNAIARVYLANGSSNPGNLSAEWVQVSYVDGSFNPTAGLNHKNLSPYVTCKADSCSWRSRRRL